MTRFEQAMRNVQSEFDATGEDVRIFMDSKINKRHTNPLQWIYSDLLRVKHNTMSLDTLIDKVYAKMEEKCNQEI